MSTSFIVNHINILNQNEKVINTYPQTNNFSDTTKKIYLTGYTEAFP